MHTFEGFDGPTPSPVKEAVPRLEALEKLVQKLMAKVKSLEAQVELMKPRPKAAPVSGYSGWPGKIVYQSERSVLFSLTDDDTGQEVCASITPKMYQGVETDPVTGEELHLIASWATVLPPYHFTATFSHYGGVYLNFKAFGVTKGKGIFRDQIVRMEDPSGVELDPDKLNKGQVCTVYVTPKGYNDVAEKNGWPTHPPTLQLVDGGES